MSKRTWFKLCRIDSTSDQNELDGIIGYVNASWEDIKNDPKLEAAALLSVQDMIHVLISLPKWRDEDLTKEERETKQNLIELCKQINKDRSND